VVFHIGAGTRGCDSATRQSSASQSPSSTTQLMWQRCGLVWPAFSLRRVEVDVGRGTDRVVGVKRCLDWAFAQKRGADARGNAPRRRCPPVPDTSVAPDTCRLLQTRQVSSHSLAMRLSWPNRCSFGSSPGSLPLGVEQPPRQVIEQRRGAHLPDAASSSRSPRQ
jgi:hypothetical protein